MSVLSRSALLANADATIEDNATKNISASDVRTLVKDITDSTNILLDTSFKILDADGAHTNDLVVKPWFPTAGTLTIPSAGLYKFSGLLRLSHGVTSHTTSIEFTTTATVTWVEYTSLHFAAAVNGIIGAQTSRHMMTFTSQSISAAVTVAEENIHVEGYASFSSSGTIIPRFNYSAAPGTTTLTKRSTRFIMEYVGPESLTSRGSWA